MDPSARQLSLTLDGIAHVLAEWTMNRHEELDPTIAERYGPSWRRSWVVDVEMRIRELAQAIAVRRPQLMVETVAWARMAHAARGMDQIKTDQVETAQSNPGPADLETNLESLRDVLAAEVPEPVREVAVSYLDLAIKEAQRHLPAHGAPLERNQPQGELTLRYLEAILTGRRRDAESLILSAVDSGVSIQDIYNNVLTPAQAEVGRMWHRGEITIADEHAATMTAEMTMAMLRTRFVRAEEHDRRMLATAVSGDLHSIGVRMVADFFELDGWRSISLGANTPAQDVIGALVDHEIDLLAVSVSSSLHLRSAGELIDAVRARPDLSMVKVIVGGRVFNLLPDLWSDLGADGFAESAEASVTLGNALVTEHRVIASA